MSVHGFATEAAGDAALQLFVNSMTDQAVFSLSPDGIIKTWSDGCTEVKRYTPVEAIGQHFRILYSPDDAELGNPELHLQLALRDGAFHEEWVRVRKGGDSFMAEVSIYPVQQNGVLIGFTKIVRDISKRRLLESQHAIREATLRKSVTDLEGFCSSVAHDLRAPIRSIVGMSNLVQRDYSEQLPEQGRKYLGRLAIAGLRLSKIIGDLLQFAKLGEKEINRQNIDVSAMAANVAAEVSANDQPGTMNFEIQEGMRANVDPSMLKLVLHNLIDNSCKYSGPDVTIQVSMLEVGDEKVYLVHDDGIGFEMKYATSIFDPFRRLHGQDEYSGTGIGLGNVKRIVERHGGRVWAEGEPGKGSTFYFTMAA